VELVKHEEHEGREGLEELGSGLDELARTVVDAGLKVHKALGPGLLESVYEQCLAHELRARDLDVKRQLALPVVYDGLTLESGYRLDILVENAVVLEIKAVDALSRVHEAQMLTYLRLSGHRLGFLMNFNVVLFKQGLRRFLL
jgi:GxxExxY protein